MKLLLSLLLLVSPALAGAQLPFNKSGGIHTNSGGLVGTFWVPQTTLVTWPYPQTDPPQDGQEWTWGDGRYTNADGDELFLTVIGWGPDWVPFAWHWELWRDNPSPPGGRIKAGEGDMY